MSCLGNLSLLSFYLATMDLTNMRGFTNHWQGLEMKGRRTSGLELLPEAYRNARAQTSSRIQIGPAHQDGRPASHRMNFFSCKLLLAGKIVIIRWRGKIRKTPFSIH